MSDVSDVDPIALIHADMPRQGPGCAEDVAWAVERLGLAGPLRVVDAGCGPGADLVALSDTLPNATIRGIEAYPHLVEEARARMAARPRVTVEQGDMARLEGPLDLIWCAGALYFLGVTEGLQGWRAALAPGGVVAFSEPVLPEGPRDVAERFWQDYPAITDMAGLAARITAAGFEWIEMRAVIGAPWADYYGPFATRLAKLRDKADPALAEVLDASALEIETWKQAPEQIQYMLCLVRPV